MLVGAHRTSLVAQTVKCLPTMRKTQVQPLGWEDLLQKEMATQYSILAWKIPWTEEPGRLQSIGSQRVRRDWATSRLPVKESSNFSTYRRFTSAVCMCVDMYMCTWEGKKGAGSERTECGFHVVRLVKIYLKVLGCILVKGMTSLLVVALSNRDWLMPALW